MNNTDHENIKHDGRPKSSHNEFLLDLFLTLVLMLLFAIGAKEMLEKDFNTWADNYPPFDK